MDLLGHGAEWKRSDWDGVVRQAAAVENSVDVVVEALDDEPDGVGLLLVLLREWQTAVLREVHRVVWVA